MGNELTYVVEKGDFYWVIRRFSFTVLPVCYVLIIGFTAINASFSIISVF